MKITRRKFLATALLATPVLLAGDGRFVEPTWLETRHVRLRQSDPVGVRLVQFSDIHHKGDRKYLQNVVEQINALSPDVICFTGDLVEVKHFLPETLDILSNLKSPVFGVPGNHDWWSRIDFPTVNRSFEKTGGAWLMDRQVTIANGKINLIGSAGLYPFTIPAPQNTGAKNILLMHYPAWAKRLTPHQFDLVMAGHSHGGQVRIPLYGAPVLPYLVDEYDRGLFQTPAGPLYVNSGIGYIGGIAFRLNCRPELTVFDI